MALKMDRENNMEALFDKFAIDPQKQNSKLEKPAEVEEEKEEDAKKETKKKK